MIVMQEEEFRKMCKILLLIIFPGTNLRESMLKNNFSFARENPSKPEGYSQNVNDILSEASREDLEFARSAPSLFWRKLCLQFMSMSDRENQHFNKWCELIAFEFLWYLVYHKQFKAFDLFGLNDIRSVNQITETIHNLFCVEMGHDFSKDKVKNFLFELESQLRARMTGLTNKGFVE